MKSYKRYFRNNVKVDHLRNFFVISKCTQDKNEKVSLKVFNQKVGSRDMMCVFPNLVVVEFLCNGFLL